MDVGTCSRLEIRVLAADDDAVNDDSFDDDDYSDDR